MCGSLRECRRPFLLCSCYSCFETLLKKSLITVTLVAAVGSEEMASGEILENVIERFTVQLKLTKATLKSTSEEFQQTQKNLETLEKEHKRVIHEIGELKKRESELIKERDEAKESARIVLESLSEFENKQYVKPSAAATRVKPEKFSGSGNDTDFQAFFDQFEACARMDGWKEEEKATQLSLSLNSRRVTRALTHVWWRLFARKSACVRFPKPLNLCSKPDEERWEKVC